MARSQGRFARLAVLLPILLVLVAYGESPLGGFVWDDHALILEQELVKSPAPLGEYFSRLFWSDPFEVSRSFYRPLVTLSYALEYQLWNGAPAGFHVTNVLLHLVVTLLLFFLIRRRGGAWTAAWGAGLFGVAPRLTESVAWISGRTDVLAAAFGFAALALWLAHPDRRQARLVASLALLMGLLSKEVAAAFIVGIGVFEFVRWRERRDGRRFGESLGFLLIPLIVYMAMRRRASSLDTRTLQVVEEFGLPWEQRWQAALATLAHYARMVVDPWRPETQIGRLGEHPPSVILIGGVVLLLSSALLLALYRRRRDEPLLFVVIGGGAIVMVLHLVPLALNVLAADRFLYVPLASFAVAASVAVGQCSRWKLDGPVLPVLAGALTLSFVLATRERVRDWNDELRFWRATEAQAGPGDFMAPFQLGGLLMEQSRWGEALAQLQVAEQRYGQPGSMKIWNNIALCLDRLGRRDESLDLFKQMKRQAPAHQQARFNLVMVQLREGNFAGARGELDSLAAALPESALVGDLQELVERSARRWKELGPPSADDPLSAIEERAEYFEELSALPEARKEWLRVLAAPHAPMPLRVRATGFLAFYGTLEEAWAAVSGLRAAGGPSEVIDGFQRVVEDRARY